MTQPTLKKQVAIRLGPREQEMLRELAGHDAVSASEEVRLLIRLRYEEVVKKKDPPK